MDVTALSGASLRRYQRARIRETLRFARENSPFYRRHIGGADIKAEDPLAALPFTDGGILARYGEQMLCASLGEIARIRTFPTSGSTGAAKRMFFTEEELSRTADFFAEGMRTIAPKDRPTCILMSDEKPGSIAKLLQDGL